MAFHDALTMLPNRILFKDRLHQALAQRREREFVAVLCLDLDQFKAVNDTLGHPVGDILLKLVAGRLTGAIDKDATVARLSGDEFAIVLTELPNPRQAGEQAARIIDAIREPYTIDGNHIDISAGIGIVVAPDDGSDGDVLLRNADMALYRAKADGRATHRFFEPAMDAHSSRRGGPSRSIFERRSRRANSSSTTSPSSTSQKAGFAGSRHCCGGTTLRAA